jgi:hypothetical protein
VSAGFVRTCNMCLLVLLGHVNVSVGFVRSCKMCLLVLLGAVTCVC